MATVVSYTYRVAVEDVEYKGEQLTSLGQTYNFIFFFFLFFRVRSGIIKGSKLSVTKFETCLTFLVLELG